MALEVRSVLKSEGDALIGGGFSGYSRFAPYGFKLGSGFAYTPTRDGNQPNGTIVYEGGPGMITSKMVSLNSVRYTLTVPEGVGPFDFGSVVLYMNAFDGTPLAFLEASFPYAIPKVISDPGISNASPFPKPGSRVVISFFHTWNPLTDESAITVQLLPAAYANIPKFDSDVNLPAPAVNPWEQFVIDNHSLTGSPAIVAKRSDGSYWGLPLEQNVMSPKFGVLSGGHAKDGYVNDQRGYAWGHKYTTPNDAYKGQVGGMSYTTVISSPEAQVIGGASY